MKLTDWEKEKIKAEEIFRQEIRQQIENDRQSRSRLQKIQSFLESPLGLLFIGSIMVPFAIWVFSTTQSYYSKLHLRQANANSIDHELTFRINRTIGKLCDGSTRQFLSDLTGIVSGYQRFAGTDTQVLMIQLGGLVTKEEKRDISQARAALMSREPSRIETALQIRGWLKEPCPAQQGAQP